MMQVSLEKSTISWFKLAELIARREKERAVTLFRLLSHSVTDKAYLFHLEGDVLAAFQDLKAQDCYIRAAELYTEQKRYLLALTMYELLITHYDDQRFVKNYMFIGSCLGYGIFFEHNMMRIISYLCDQKMHVTIMRSLLSWPVNIKLKLPFLHYIITQIREPLNYCISHNCHNKMHSIEFLVSSLHTILEIPKERLTA